MNTVRDEFTRAGLMDYLVHQVAVMNAYAALCPVAGRVVQKRVDGTLKHLHRVRALSKVLRVRLGVGGSKPRCRGVKSE